MASSQFPPGWSGNPLAVARLLLHIPNFIKLYWRLFTDRRVSWLPKAVLVASILYLIIPYDIDFLGPVGYLDDIAVLIIAAKAFIKLCPRRVVQEHVQLIDQGG